MKPGHTPEPGEEAQIIALGHLQTGILDAVRAGTPLLAIPQTDTLSDGVAKELAAAGAFTYNGAVGDFRAPWMGNWYFVREHALFDRPPTKSAPSAASTSAKAAPPTASSSTKHLTAHPSKSSLATPATTTAMLARAPSPRDSAKAKCSSIAAPTSTPFCSNAFSPTHCAGSRPEHRTTQRDTIEVVIPIQVIAELRAAVGDANLIIDRTQLQTYECDGLTNFRALPGAVVLPREAVAGPGRDPRLREAQYSLRRARGGHRASAAAHCPRPAASSSASRA